MSPRVFFGWLIVTVITVVLATFVVLDRPTAKFDPVEREPVFADLRANPDAAAKVEVRSRFGSFSMVRADGAWSTPDRFNYQVDSNDVRRLIVSISDMRYIERKTSLPERFARLEVDDVDGINAESAYVRISDDSDKVLAEAIVGRASARFIDGSVSGTYIREPDTTNVWLVSGIANVQTRLVPWLERSIVSVPANTVARVELSSGEGTVVLSRETPDSEDFVLADAPEGRTVDKRNVTSISRALANVDLEDIQPVGDLPLPGDAQTAKVTTFDGVTVAVRLANIDKKNWATFTASYTGDPTDQSDEAKAARATVDEINQRVSEWVYWLPSAAFENLTRKLDDVLEPKKEEAS
ncbi:MAG: DUF4340 domain-containing protein [Alphaproteobacteria bacterium]|nr:DUF4340 domain-containing protein [Alphaproteobacteria bacterium]